MRGVERVSRRWGVRSGLVACLAVPPKKRHIARLDGLPHTLCRSVLFPLLWAALAASAELPEFYKSVDRVFWVVDDIDRTTVGGPIAAGGGSAGFEI